jgi:ABC-2 type transport system permease protein
MTTNIFLLELRLLARDKSSWVLLALLAGAVLYGIANGERVAERVAQAGLAGEAAVDQAHEAVRAHLSRLAQNPRGGRPLPAYTVALRGASARLPPAPLPALAVGQADLSPAHEKISPFGATKPSENRAELENPSHLLSGAFDLSFVLIWLFPLFVLGLVYDLMAGDRESGTLRLALAQGIKPFGWMLRRAVARSLPLFLVACFAILLAWGVSDVEVGFSRAALAAGVVIAYGLFWLALAMAVNTVAKSAASAATALGSCWVLLVLIAPTLLNVAVESAFPTPSRVALVAVGREAGAEVEKKGAEVIESFYRDHPELAPEGQRASSFSRTLAIDLEVREAIDPKIAQFDEQLAAQQAAVAKWRFLSPAIAAHEALTDLAGTGYWRYRAFREQVTTYRKSIADYYAPKVHRGEPFQLADYSEVPVFVFQEPDKAWAGRAGAGIGGIFALSAILALGTLWSLRAGRLGSLAA